MSKNSSIRRDGYARYFRGATSTTRDKNNPYKDTYTFDSAAKVDKWNAGWDAAEAADLADLEEAEVSCERDRVHYTSSEYIAALVARIEMLEGRVNKLEQSIKKDKFDDQEN